jgi:hypothetical protein
MLFEVDLWVSGVCSALIAWKLFLKPPSRVVTGVLAIIFFATVYFKYRTFFGRDPAAHFLTILACLKILENKDHRDEKFIFLLGIFMLIGRFLFTIELMVATAHLILLYGLFWSFLKIQNSQVQHKFLVKQMVFSMPITLLIFFLFPRFTHNLSGLVDSENFNGVKRSGFSGYGSNLQPGSISQLLQSDDLVFRARFKGSDPRSNDMYWRGDVLELNEGFEWKKVSELTLAKSEVESSNSFTSKNANRKLPIDRVTYEVMLEPHQNKWIFALERSLLIQGEGITESKRKNGVFTTDRIMSSRQTYFGEAQTEGFLTLLAIMQWNHVSLQNQKDSIKSENFSKIFVQHAPLSPAMEDFVADFKSQISPESTRLNRVKVILDYFAKNDFRYSLSPGDRSMNLEDFMLHGKSGFCEHYSSAFTILARALQVPARVVVGYHGGTYNPMGGFWTITQKNAHAWAEVLIESDVWVRIDPTSALPESETRELFNIGSLSSDKKQSGNLFASLLSDASLYIDTLNYKWNGFFLDFDQNTQRDLFEEISSNLKSIGIILVLVLIVYFGLNHLFLWFQTRKKRHRIEGLYDELSTMLRRPKNLGPQEWSELLKQKYPLDYTHAKPIIESYIMKTYALSPIPKARMAELQKALEFILAQKKKVSQFH